MAAEDEGPLEEVILAIEGIRLAAEVRQRRAGSIPVDAYTGAPWTQLPRPVMREVLKYRESCQAQKVKAMTSRTNQKMSERWRESFTSDSILRCPHSRQSLEELMQFRKAFMAPGKEYQPAQADFPLPFEFAVLPRLGLLRQKRGHGRGEVQAEPEHLLLALRHRWPYPRSRKLANRHFD